MQRGTKLNLRQYDSVFLKCGFKHLQLLIFKLVKNHISQTNDREPVCGYATLLLQVTTDLQTFKLHIM